MEECESDSLDDCKPLFSEGVNDLPGMVPVKSEPQMDSGLLHDCGDTWRPSQYTTGLTTFGEVTSEMADIVSETEDSKPFGVLESQSCVIHGNDAHERTTGVKSSINDSGICLNQRPAHSSDQTCFLTAPVLPVNGVKPVYNDVESATPVVLSVKLEQPTEQNWHLDIHWWDYHIHWWDYHSVKLR
jgi:hypothetical protein